MCSKEHVGPVCFFGCYSVFKDRSFRSVQNKATRRNVRDEHVNLIDRSVCVKLFSLSALRFSELSGPCKIKCFRIYVNNFFLRAVRVGNSFSEAGNIKNRSAFVNLFLCRPSSFFHRPFKLRDSSSTSAEPCQKDRGKLQNST